VIVAKEHYRDDHLLLTVTAPATTKTAPEGAVFA